MNNYITLICIRSVVRIAAILLCLIPTIIFAEFDDDTNSQSYANAELWTDANALWITYSPINQLPEYSGFGGSPSLQGNLALIGASRQNQNGKSFVGNAFIYNIKTGEWLDLSKTPNSPINQLPKGSGFGRSPSLQGNLALIGASGNAFIYNIKTGEWLDLSKTPNSPINQLPKGSGFGRSPSLQGNLALIAAPWQNQNGNSAVGNAFIYNIKTGEWLDLSKTPNSPINQLPKDSGFGGGTSLQGNLALIAASGQDQNGKSNVGNAFIYNIKTGEWLDLSKTPNSPINQLSATSHFGGGTSLQGNLALIGASRQNQNGKYYVGNAFIYNIKTGEWLDLSKTPNSPINQLPEVSYFGNSTSLQGNLALIGANSQNQNGKYYVGNAFIYNIKTGEWLDLSKTPNSPINQLPKGSGFGVGTSLQGNLALIGASGQDQNGKHDVGNAFIYNIKTGEWLDLSIGNVSPRNSINLLEEESPTDTTPFFNPVVSQVFGELPSWYL
ncbi:MAG: hypothetical protein QM538_07210, partial [Methylacidiphilales bacterium]|nr:hypothetical protein [Candidatus Methylacidiphilales bacterium]